MTEPGETSFTRAAFAAALGALALAGAIDASYGPLLRPVTHRLGVSLPVAGTLISINLAGGLAGTVCAMAALTRAPRRPAAAFALGMLGLGCLSIAAARGWPELTAGVFLTGTGFGATDFSLNQLGARTAARGRGARLTMLNAAFGAGAVLGPAAVGWLGLRTLTLGFAAAAVAAGVMAAGVLGITTAAPAAPEAPAEPAPAGGAGGRKRGPAGRVGRPYRAVAVVALGYLLYVGCESGTAGWIPAHLVALGYPPRLATTVTSGFWAAMTVGRLAAAPLSRRVAAPRMVLAACLLLTLMLALTTVPAVAPGCYVAAGFAAAPIFPIGLDWVAAAFTGYHPATSWALVASFSGGIAGPAAVAGVVSVAGVHAVPTVLTGFAAAAAFSFLAIWWTGRVTPRTAPSTGCGQGTRGTA